MKKDNVFLTHDITLVTIVKFYWTTWNHAGFSKNDPNCLKKQYILYPNKRLFELVLTLK